MNDESQLSRYVAEMARLLDFEVLICDPRTEFVYGWEEQHGRFVPGMPDEAVPRFPANSLVLTVTSLPGATPSRIPPPLGL